MKRKGEFIFEVLILGVIIGFVFYSLSYSPTARLVPLVVGIPGIIFGVLQLIGSLPGVSKRLEKLSSTKDLFGTKGIKPKEEEAQEPEEEVEETSTPAWIVFVWIVGFTALIILFGYLVAVPVLVFSFLKFRSGASWLYSILSAVGIEVVMYGGFVLLLNVFLYEGLVFNLIAGR
ncbi:MAG: tripartite tricarboxylate transporter TctB family protein [Thermodesulfobacteriota bacterium]